MIEPGKLIDLRDHQPAAVQHHEHVLAPFGLEVPRHEPAVAGGRLPGGVGRIVAGHIIPQALEHAPPAAEPDRRQPHLRRAMPHGGQLVAGQAGHVGIDLHRVAGADPHLADQQPQLQSPAEEDVAELVQPPPRRRHAVAQFGRGRGRIVGRHPRRLPLDRFRHVLGHLERTAMPDTLRISQPTWFIAPSERCSGSRRWTTSCRGPAESEHGQPRDQQQHHVVADGQTPAAPAPETKPAPAAARPAGSAALAWAGAWQLALGHWD